MRKPQGYAVWTDPYATTTERDTVTCNHCQKVGIVKPRQDPADMGGMCKVCMALICSRCVGMGACTPWEETLERVEARDRFLRAAGIKGG